MKKLILISVVLFIMLSVFNVNAIEPQSNTSAKVLKTTKVEVYYFHNTRRCATCQAVETESQKSIKELYPKQFKDGSIKFIGVNLEEKNSKVLIEKCKAEGQALLVISNDKRIDLTDKGFMYARTKPERLKAELKKAIDPLLK